MGISYELLDQIYMKLGVPSDTIAEMSAIAFKLLGVLQGTTDTNIKLFDPVDMKQYLVPCFLTACGVNYSTKPIIIIESGNLRLRRAINLLSDISHILKDMDIAFSMVESTIHGGKVDYLCRRRYFDFIRSSAGSQNPLVAKLVNQGAPHNIELFRYVNVTDLEKRKFSVQDCNYRCTYYNCCAYVERLKSQKVNQYTFHLCDPYVFSKQILDYYEKGRPIQLPYNAAVIIPNPASLEKSACSILTRKIFRKAIIRFISELLTATTGSKAYHHRVRIACNNLEKTSNTLFNDVERSTKTMTLCKLLEKIIKDMRKIQNTCINELSQNNRLKKELEYMLSSLEDCLNGYYEAIMRPQYIELTLKAEHRNKELVQALKYAPMQVIFLTKE